MGYIMVQFIDFGGRTFYRKLSMETLYGMVCDGLIALSLLHTYDCYTSIATPEKRNELTLGHLHGPWTELTLNSPSV